MNERINKLLIDGRLYGLTNTKEFVGAFYKLRLYKKKLRDKKELFEPEVGYVESIEKHIENIYGHFHKVTVNGVLRDVWFDTKGE